MGKSWACCCAALVALVAPLHGAAHAMTTTKIAWTMAANQANRSVVWGSARFTVLTPRLIRLEYSGSFPPHFDDLPSTLVLDRAECRESSIPMLCRGSSSAAAMVAAPGGCPCDGGSEH